MASPTIDTSPNQSILKDLANKGTLNIFDDIKGTIGNVSELEKGLGKLSSAWSSNISQTAKLSASLGALGSIAVNTTFGIANISSAFNKLQGAKSIVDGVYSSVKSLSGVSKTLDFSEAILGTKELSQNIKTLEETADTTFNKISTATQIIFDNQSYQKWSIGAVAAYSKVESAAFKLATITTSSEQSALSVIEDRIKALRELQRQTDFATNSTQTLNAQYDIASAGFASKEGQKAVGKASINLSEVGYGQLEGTNQGIVKILAANKNLGDSFRDADKRASQLFATTKVGILTLDQLNSEAAELASTGASAGVSFEEMATSLALVTTQGIGAAEGSTAIKALVSEIVSNIPKAQEALGTLRDEAGKPIQFGFGALKSEGLINIIERIGKATGGSRDALNRIFSSKEAVTAANALLQSGSENRRNFRDTIDEAGSDKGQDKLKQSAKERGQTLEGAFRASFNKSQAAVEDFGSGVGESVKKNLQDTNTLLGVLATRSSSSFGSFAGQLDGVANKFQAVAGFAGTVFNVVAPLAFFSFLFKNLGRLGQVIKQTLKLDDGDIKYENIGQKIEATIVRIAKSVVLQVRGLVDKVNNEISRVGSEVSSSKTKTLVAPNLEVKNSSALPSIKDTAKQTTQALGSLYNATSPIRGVIGSAAKELGSFALSTGIVGGAASLLFTALQGGVTSFNAYANAAKIPEIKELTEDLKQLKGVSGLDSFVKGLSDSKAQLRALSEEARVANVILSNLSQSFNILNGNTAQNDVFQRKTDEANSLLTAQINIDQASIKSGEFKAVTEAEKTAKQKIKLGITLNEEDVQAVKASIQSQKDIIQQRISNVQSKIKLEEEKGGIGSRERVEDFQEQLSALKAQAKEQERNLETEQKRIILGSQLKRLQSFDSKIPIAVSTSVAFNSSSKAQFNQLKETLDKVFTVDKIDLSKVDIQEFSKILPQLQGNLSNITVQADIDPRGAIESLKRLTSDVKVLQFVASDPTAQKALDEAFKVATDKILSYNDLIANSYSNLFSTISNAGAVGDVAIGQATARRLQGIRSSIESLRESLNAPNINAQEYADRLSKIAELSSQAFSIKNSGQITEELSKRKQLLSFNQSILEVQKNIVSIFAQESKFGSFGVSLAQAKLAAAEKELSVKQESLAISAKEEEITKRNILEAAQAEVSNRTQLLQQTLKAGNISPTDAKSNLGINTAIDLASNKDVAAKKAEADKIIALNQKKLEDSRKNSNVGLVSISPEQEEEIRKEVISRALSSGRRRSDKDAIEGANQKLDSITKKSSEGTFVDLKLLSTITNSEKIDSIVEQLRETTEKQQNSFISAINNAQKSKEAVTGASGQLKERVSNIDIDSAKKAVQQAEQDLKFTVVANKFKQEIGALSETIARNEAAIEASFANQQRIINISKGLGDSFSNLSSTASSLFSSSSLGASFASIGSKLADKTSQVILDANVEISKITAKLNTLQSVRDRVVSANEEAKKSGVNSPELKKQQEDVERQLKTAKAEYEKDLLYVKQKTILEGVNSSLERFGAIAKEGSDKLEKVANIANARLDLQNRKDQSSLQNNQATRGFSSSVLSLFGKNNPAAEALIGRNEILGLIDKTAVDKNDAARSGEKELNTLEVERQQLLTQDLMLTNALTQTQLLGKLVEKIDPSSGINVGDISSVNSVIASIPDNIQNSKIQTQKALDLNTETQNFVKQDTFNKIRNIDLNGQSQILDIAQKNPLAGLTSPETFAALRNGIDLSRQNPVQKIPEYKPFGEDFKETQKQFQGIGNSTRESIIKQAKEYQEFLNKDAKKITNEFASSSPNKPQNTASASGQQNLSVIVNNSISIDGVKTTFGGDSLNRVGAAVGKNADVIQKSLNEFGQAFLNLSKNAFGV